MKAVCLIFLFICLATFSAAQTASSPPSWMPTVQPSCTSGSPGIISVSGRGEAKATADTAEVFLQISIRNRTAEGAKQVAAGFANAVITAVRQIPGIQPDNVTTTAVSVAPVSSRNQDGTSTTIAYTYTNSLSVEIGNVSNDLLSNVLDTAVNNGGNNLTISSVSFSLSDALSYNKTVEARTQAARDARTTATQYAEGLGVNLGPLLTVTDESIESAPVQERTFSQNAIPATRSSEVGSQTTPISIGKGDVTAAITTVYTICSPAP